MKKYKGKNYKVRGMWASFSKLIYGKYYYGN